MKYLYCPQCKELRVKPWYAISNRCQRCFADATVIPIPNNWMTYLSYVLYVTVPALIAVYLYTDVRNYLYYAIAGLVVMMIVSYVNLSRGEAYARARIKVAVSSREDLIGG